MLPSRPVLPALPDLARIQALYDQSRFMDAYRTTADLWREPALVDRLGVEQLVLAGRLVGRLGGNKVRRWLFRVALAADPEHPQVRYFARSSVRPRWHLLEQLKELERQPEPGFGDPALEASWLATHAHLLALVRDFDRAGPLLERARGIGGEPAWVGCCAAEVLLLEDRWQEALSAAEEVCASAPGMPAGYTVLARALVKLGRLEEAVERLTAAAGRRQSFELLLLAVWYTCALAERGTAGQRRRLARIALDLAAGLDDLAPLADRESRSQIAGAHVDAAMLLGDHDLARRQADRVLSPYLRAVLANLGDGEERGLRLVPFRAVYQKHQTCLPAALAAVAGGFGVELDVDELAHRLTYNGTAMWRLVDWLRRQGFLTRPFVATPDLVRSLLEAGLPFVYLMESLSSSHAAAAVGLDEATGTLILHDPGDERWVRVLVARMNEDEAPFGPQALAVVPPERAELLDLIPSSATEPYAAHLRFERTLETRGIRAAEEVTAGLARRFPDHPYALRLKALARGMAGDTFAAIELQERLLARYPDCLPLRRDLLSSLHRTHNTARIRQAVADLVERGVHPGISQKQSWWFPPATYVARYADFVGLTQEGFARAERLLWKGIQYYPTAAELYHVLGDVYARQDRHRDSVLPLRVASCLEDQEEHYARAACDALRLVRREAEGLVLLGQRVRRHGHRLKGGGPWVTWVETLEDYGRPEEAIDAMARALEARPDDAELHARAVQFWSRMGCWDQAEQALARVERDGNQGLFLEAATRFHLTAGRWDEAFELARRWHHETPDDVGACRLLLHLTARRQGPDAALALAEQWAGAHEGHDELELLYREELDRNGRPDEAEAVLRNRLERNPLDSWAWRELGHLLMERVEGLPPERGQAALREVDDVLSAARRLSPDSPATLLLDARVEEHRGHRERAVELLLEALDVDPELAYAYQQAWELTTTSPREEQERTLERLERRLLRSVAHLHCARDLAFRIADRFGLERAERAVESWSVQAPDDPELVQTRVDLLLQRGQGRSDAERAREMLEPAIARFPNHAGLRFSWAHTCAILLREEEEAAALREVLRREPLNLAAHRNLAQALARRGETAAAVELLEEGCRRDPLAVDLVEAWSGLLWETGEPARALDVLEQAVERIPRNLYLREQLVDRLREAGDTERAVAVARRGVETDPDAAYAHFLLADTLRTSEVRSVRVEVERTLRRALELDPRLFAAADGLAVQLAAEDRWPEARAIVEEQVEPLTDPSPALGRLAWLTRAAGDKDRARAEMADVVRRFPLYRWGWWQLLDWLEEDEAWEESRGVLAEVHPAISSDPLFTARRLTLLELAGAPSDQLDPEWERALHDFPDLLELHLRRVDLLLSREDWDGAAALAEAQERFHPEASYLLARKVQALAGGGRSEEALAAARALWQLPGDTERWPEEAAWAALAGAGLARGAAAEAWGLVASGSPLRLRAFELLLDNLRELPSAPLRRDALLAGSSRRRLLMLADLLAAAPWDDGRRLAAALERLGDTGGRRLALRFWRRHQHLCRSKTPVWQKIGYLLTGAGPSGLKTLRRWMADWREHPDVEMWALANYSLSLRSLPGPRAPGEDLAELEAVSLAALDRPHDITVRHHACVACEAALRAGDDAEFLRRAGALEPALADDDPQLWVWNRYAWAPRALLLFRELLESEDPGVTVELGRRFARCLTSATPSWVAREWLRRAGPHLGPGQRLGLRLRIAWARMVR